MKHEESHIQRSICEYLDVALPPSHRYFAVPNGGVRNIREASRLKGEGVRPGVPDICIIARSGYVGFLEVKTKTGKLSPAQKEWRDWLVGNQIPYGIVKSILEVQILLTDWNIPLKVKIT